MIGRYSGARAKTNTARLKITKRKRYCATSNFGIHCRTRAFSFRGSIRRLQTTVICESKSSRYFSTGTATSSTLHRRKPRRKRRPGDFRPSKEHSSTRETENPVENYENGITIRGGIKGLFDARESGVQVKRMARVRKKRLFSC